MKALTNGEKQMQLARAEVIRQLLSDAGVDADLKGLTAYETAFSLRTSQKIGPVIESIYVKWVDVAAVYVNSKSDGQLILNVVLEHDHGND